MAVVAPLSCVSPAVLVARHGFWDLEGGNDCASAPEDIRGRRARSFSDSFLDDVSSLKAASDADVSTEDERSDLATSSDSDDCEVTLENSEDETHERWGESCSDDEQLSASSAVEGPTVGPPGLWSGFAQPMPMIAGEGIPVLMVPMAGAFDNSSSAAADGSRRRRRGCRGGQRRFMRPRRGEEEAQESEQ